MNKINTITCAFVSMLLFATSCTDESEFADGWLPTNVYLKQTFSFNESGIENGHGYIDLGLSVKWATMNIGATSPEDYGDYFAWGETQPKGTYNWDTYPDSLHHKYIYGNKSRTLDPEDDAARVNWGGNWRMPTQAELEELQKNCKWMWTTLKDVEGWAGVSKRNGNSIFLPVAGWFMGDKVCEGGESAKYWSATYQYIGEADCLSFPFMHSSYRYYGFTVRAVLAE